MFRSKPVGLLLKILCLILVVYMALTFLHVRRQISDTKNTIETLTQQVNDQTQTNTELSNAIENRDDPSYIEDIAREKRHRAIITRRIHTIYGNQCRRNSGRNHQKYHQVRRVRHPARGPLRPGPHL